MSDYVCHSCGVRCSIYGHAVEDHKGEFLRCEDPQRWAKHQEAVANRIKRWDIQNLHELLEKYPFEARKWLGERDRGNANG